MKGKPKEILFEASGTFRDGKIAKKFTKAVGAASRKHAEEKVLSLMGSKHGTKRRFVKIEKIGEHKEA